MTTRKRFSLPANELTAEAVFRERRTFLKLLGFAGLNAWPFLQACSNFAMESRELGGTLVNLKTLPARPNDRYRLDRPLTDRLAAAKYNNFYEFTSGKDVWRYVDQFVTRPWQVAVSGLVKKPQVFAIDELIRTMPLEERSYRHRCVEAWAMAVPWTGFPLAELVKRVEPQSGATHVRFLSFLRRDQAPNQRGVFSTDLWPYHEGLTLAEATNELTFLAVGVYGKELPKQHGAPIRLVTPWKYGFKGIKSIVAIEFVDHQPPTFWNQLVPDEYGFWANVNPDMPHPRWSQQTERLLGSDEQRQTVIFNGYGEFVAHLYQPPRREFFF
ncbi:mononuclear molybdenum enzyme YedY [Geotalea uraniireducens]|uniref:Mononuclear molybdenum enzyme YedY n=1 Tax=Geotalea uraniireducens TaxID=351604 RepID=A0ABM8EII8_9BACT|nr:protein-methionine-sulfoxide reductase catalytic subunit MsrP [Geotalea uraniireducens]BDV42062.1 mononuclear molybdenum enzyme YedY [Geotalea uraniireducens]